MISNFGSFNSNKKNSKHHEDSPVFETKFRRHHMLLINAFKQFGNPFADPYRGHQNIVSKEIFPEATANSVSTALKLGKQQSQRFVKERIVRSSEVLKSLYDTITKNKLALFHKKNPASISKEKLAKSPLQETVKLYANLYVGCQTSLGDMDKFFRHENHDFSPSLSLTMGGGYESRLTNRISCRAYLSWLRMVILQK